MVETQNLLRYYLRHCDGGQQLSMASINDASRGIWKARHATHGTQRKALRFTTGIWDLRYTARYVCIPYKRAPNSTIIASVKPGRRDLILRVPSGATNTVYFTHAHWTILFHGYSGVEFFEGLWPLPLSLLESKQHTSNKEGSQFSIPLRLSSVGGCAPLLPFGDVAIGRLDLHPANEIRVT